MNNFLKVVSAVALILILLWLLVPAPEVQDRMIDMPWQIEPQDDGSSKVLGLHLGVSSLQDAIKRYGEVEGMALFSSQPNGENMTLEAYFGTVRNGPLAAKLVLVLDVTEEATQAMAARATGRKPGPSGAYQWNLAEADKQAALNAIVKGVTYIPIYSKLDADFFSSRFGEPVTRQRIDERVQRWAYPDKGLSIVIDDAGKEVLHYMLPREFRLAPIAQPASGAGS